MKFLKNVLYAILLVVLFSTVVYAAASKEAEKVELPSLSRFEINQIGDNELLLFFYGKKLPTPEMVAVGDKLEIVFRDSLSENIQKPNPDISIISNIETEQRENDTVVVIQSLDDNFLVKELRGTGPSDRYTMTLVTQRHVERLETEAETVQKRLPPIPVIPDFQKTSPVDINVINEPLENVIMMMAGAVRRNLVVDQSLPHENVTMAFSKAPINVVVDHLKKMYDIDFAMMGNNTIVAGSRVGLAKMTGREITKAFHIAYVNAHSASAQSIIDLLSRVMQLNAEETDKMVFDARLNQLYITASPERLEEFAVALQNLDKPGKQVMLSARLLEFSDAYAKEVDSMINTIYDNWWLNYNNGTGRIGVNTDNGIRGTTPSPTWTPVSDIVDGTWRYIDAAIQATEEKNIAKVLANPSLIVMDGHTANIDLQQQIPYKTLQEGSTSVVQLYSTEFEDVGPNISMTPIIGRNGVITIKATIESSVLVEMTTDGPSTSDRRIDTTVRVRNGEPFVVGGLNDETNTKLRRKIPILGDIPLLGNLFRYTNNVTRRSQVVMIVIPYIIDTPDSQIEEEPLLFRR